MNTKKYDESWCLLQGKIKLHIMATITTQNLNMITPNNNTVATINFCLSVCINVVYLDNNN